MWEQLFVLGLLLLPLQFVGVSIAQLGHLWAAMLVTLLVFHRRIRVGALEILILLLFVAVALINTRYSGAPNIKAGQQLLKFALVYPAFYLVGRFYGERYLNRPLPFGFWLVVAFIGLQWAIQYFQVPVLYKALDFQRDAIHGTFKERNWFALFFFFLSYMLLLKTPGRWTSALGVFSIGLLLTVLSGSKSVLVVCGIALLFSYRGQLTLKVLAVVVGTAVFIELFGWQLSGEMLRVRLENERGLAFVLSSELISSSWMGYGFGFVEAHFGKWWYSVQGLGYGTNSVFASPLDLVLIAGPAGALFWMVFFGGLGFGWRTMLLLAPVAAWSLINPLHQSEIAYLMLGYLVSWGSSAAATQAETSPARFTSTPYSDDKIIAGASR